MKVLQTKIKDLLIIEPTIYTDERGWFMESFNNRDFNKILINLGYDESTFVQDNHSLSHKGVLRGLHFQRSPYTQSKLIRVIQGRIWDVAVDIRPDSDSFGQWFGIELSETNQKQFWIPAGFAHGFLALEDHTQVLYKTTNYYHKESEETLIWNDPDLAIFWPINQNLKINQSEKDSSASTFADLKYYLSIN